MSIMMDLESCKENINQSGITLLNFIKELLHCCIEIMENGKRIETHREDFITIMHESQKFKELAITKFGFELPSP